MSPRTDHMVETEKPCCKWCEGPATIEAFDYGDGVGSWWCESCRQAMRCGASPPTRKKKTSEPA